ncbi:unnamed protein product, partial [Mycena citricolor]
MNKRPSRSLHTARWKSCEVKVMDRMLHESLNIRSENPAGIGPGTVWTTWMVTDSMQSTRPTGVTLPEYSRTFLVPFLWNGPQNPPGVGNTPKDLRLRDDMLALLLRRVSATASRAGVSSFQERKSRARQARKLDWLWSKYSIGPFAPNAIVAAKPHSVSTERTQRDTRSRSAVCASARTSGSEDGMKSRTSVRWGHRATTAGMQSSDRASAPGASWNATRVSPNERGVETKKTRWSAGLSCALSLVNISLCTRLLLSRTRMQAELSAFAVRDSAKSPSLSTARMMTFQTSGRGLSTRGMDGERKGRCAACNKHSAQDGLHARVI